MKIVIPGGSGQVGNILAREFHKDGHEIVILSRNPSDQLWRSVRWDGTTLEDWISELNGADVVINLAGRSVDCRYNSKNRKEIMESRINSTRVIGEAINQVEKPPHTWLQASTATIYAHRYDAPNDESTGIIGGNEIDAPKKWGYSIEVAKSWEKTLDDAIVPKTRKIILRSSLILSPDQGGIFDTLLRLVRYGLGGRAGDGKQYVSWVHDSDFVSAISWLIEHRELEGVVNITSPNPLPFSQFMKEMRS
ncbi:MAG: epimerase, partial [Candidatus Heimdallarchaeota archaeon]